MTGSSNPPAGRNSNGLVPALFALLFILVLAVFHPVVHGEFLNWDDNWSISANTHLGDLGWSKFEWFFTNIDYSPRCQPLSWVVWAVVRKCFGPGPFPAHTAVLLFHAANAGLVFLLVRRLLLLANAARDDRAVSICAALAAALWAAHPLRVETTAWAVELVFRPAGLFFFFSLLFTCASAVPGRAATSVDQLWPVCRFPRVLFPWPWPDGRLSALDIFPLRRPGPGPGQMVIAGTTCRLDGKSALRNRHHALRMRKLPRTLPVRQLRARPHARGIWSTARVMQAFFTSGPSRFGNHWLPLDLAPHARGIDRFPAVCRPLRAVRGSGSRPYMVPLAAANPLDGTFSICGSATSRCWCRPSALRNIPTILRIATACSSTLAGPLFWPACRPDIWPRPRALLRSFRSCRRHESLSWA